MGFELLVWNIQCLPSPLSYGEFDLGELFASRMRRKVEAVLGVVARLPTPDAIAFAEVFSIESMNLLRAGLRAHFPHSHWHLPDPLIAETASQIDIAAALLARTGKMIPSGLLLVSKFRFSLADFREYPVSTGDDRFAAKGAAFYSFNVTSIGPLNLVLTHMQAEDMSGPFPLPPRHVREGQLALLRTELPRVFPGSRAPTLIVGDFNIPALSDEWEMAGLRNTDFWQRDMPPEDPGNTADAFTTRLDYIVLNPSPLSNLAAYHIRLVGHGASDHLGLLASLGPAADHCTPAAAVSLNLTGNFGVLHVPSGPGELLTPRWIRINTAGSFVFFPVRDTQFEVYEQTNISAAKPYFEEVFGGIPNPDLDAIIGDETPVGNGFEYSLFGPGFIKVLAPDDYRKRPAIGWWRKMGRAPWDAILLTPQRPPYPALSDSWTFTNPQSYDGDLRTWFRCAIGSTEAGELHKSRFVLDNADGHDASLELYRSTGNSLTLIDATSGEGSLSLEYTTVGPEAVLLAVRRKDPVHDGFSVRWATELTYMLGAAVYGEPSGVIHLYCADETGPDWMGEDEAVLFVAGKSGVRKYPVGADYVNINTGDSHPLPFVPLIFRDAVIVSVVEKDNLGDDAGQARIPALAEADAGDDPQSSQPLRGVELRVSTGKYHVRYLLSRTRPSGRG